MMKKLLGMVVISLLWSNIGYAKKLDIHLKCNFDDGGVWVDYIHILNDKAAIDNYPYNNPVKYTDNFINIDNKVVINRYTLRFKMYKDGPEGTCKVLKKKI